MADIMQLNASIVMQEKRIKNKERKWVKSTRVR